MTVTNTGEKQLEGGKVDFDPQFHRFQARLSWLCCFWIWWRRHHGGMVWRSKVVHFMAARKQR
jgi:hypothetical protein